MRLIPKTNFLTAMGRHSLPVFCAGSLLSMTGAVVRYEWGGGFSHDTIIVAAGLVVMAILARFLDGREPAPPKALRIGQPVTT
jgi:hypothetical protein